MLVPEPHLDQGATQTWSMTSVVSKSWLQERHGWDCEAPNLVEVVFSSRTTAFIQTSHQGATQTWSMGFIDVQVKVVGKTWMELRSARSVELVFKSRSTTFIQTLHQGTTQTWSMASMASKRGLLCPRHDNSANEGMAKQCQRRGRVFEVYGQLLVLLKLSPRITIGGCNWTYARWRLSSLQEKNWEAGRKLAETEKP